MTSELDSFLDFPIEPRNVNTEELGELFWDFCKKASRVLYDTFTKELARHDLTLTKKGQIVLTRQLLIVNMWSVCKAWMEHEEALEVMHQKYLRGVTLFFEEHGKQEDVWAFAKKELMLRYRQYYSHWMNNSLNVSNEEIVALTSAILSEMIQHTDLILGGTYQKIIVMHLKVALKALLKMKQHVTVAVPT